MLDPSSLLKIGFQWKRIKHFYMLSMILFGPKNILGAIRVIIGDLLQSLLYCCALFCTFRASTPADTNHKFRGSLNFTPAVTNNSFRNTK
jgi:hypothetical protein